MKKYFSLLSHPSKAFQILLLAVCITTLAGLTTPSTSVAGSAIKTSCKAAVVGTNLAFKCRDRGVARWLSAKRLPASLKDNPGKLRETIRAAAQRDGGPQPQATQNDDSGGRTIDIVINIPGGGIEISIPCCKGGKGKKKKKDDETDGGETTTPDGDNGETTEPEKDTSTGK